MVFFPFVNSAYMFPDGDVDCLEIHIDELRFHARLDRSAQVVNRKRQAPSRNGAGEQNGVERLAVVQLVKHPLIGNDDQAV